MSKKQVTIPIFVPHEGCPHQCAFCNQFSISGSTLIPDKKNVTDKINNYLKTIPEKIDHVEVAFFGGSFTGIEIQKQEELLDSVQPYIKKQLIKEIRISTRPDYINEDILTFLDKYNVSTIELGVQSFDDIILENAKRGHSGLQVFDAVELIKSFNFKFIIQLMPGLPGDKPHNSITDAQTAAELNPNGVRIYPTVVLKNTILDKLYKLGKYTPLSLSEAIERCSEMIKILKLHNIPVIRTGLHPMDNQELDNIVCGPYHTAFGFMVNSRLKLDELIEHIELYLTNTKRKPVTIHLLLPKIRPEEYIGLKKNNIHTLEKLFHKINIKYSIHEKSCLEIKGE